MNFIIYLMISNLFLINCLHLTNYQMRSIVNLIKNQKINLEQREKINNVLYKSYEKMAIKKAIDFKNSNKFKCKNINTNELILSSKIGLFKSIKKYNGNSCFVYYSNLYIRRELLKTLTDNFAFSIIPKEIRKKNKKNFSYDEMVRYKIQLNTEFINHLSNYKFDKNYSLNQETNLDKIIKYESNQEIWNNINNLDPFVKRIIYLKYDYEFNKIRNNKKISELMCCSEENIRFKLEEKFKPFLVSNAHFNIYISN